MTNVIRKTEDEIVEEDGFTLLQNGVFIKKLSGNTYKTVIRCIGCGTLFDCGEQSLVPNVMWVSPKCPDCELVQNMTIVGNQTTVIKSEIKTK